MTRIVLIMCSVFFLLSCGNKEKPKVVEKPRVFPQYYVALDEILKTKDGVIRGINLNSQADSIKKMEKVQPLEEEKVLR